MNGIGFDRLGKPFPDGSLFGLGRVGGTNQLAEISHGIVFFQNHWNDGSGRHIGAQIVVKRAFAVNGVKLAGPLFRQQGFLYGYNPKSGFFDHLNDCTGIPLRHGVGFNHRERTVGRHQGVKQNIIWLQRYKD